jgi:hypothetical protein
MSHHFEMATTSRGETIYDKDKLIDLGKTYMAELNERLDEQARAAGAAGVTQTNG